MSEILFLIDDYCDYFHSRNCFTVCDEDDDSPYSPGDSDEDLPPLPKVSKPALPGIPKNVTKLLSPVTASQEG